MCVELNVHAIIVYALTIKDLFQGNASFFFAMDTRDADLSKDV